jgi:hypothetical protein
MFVANFASRVGPRHWNHPKSSGPAAGRREAVEAQILSNNATFSTSTLAGTQRAFNIKPFPLIMNWHVIVPKMSTWMTGLSYNA